MWSALVMGTLTAHEPSHAAHTGGTIGASGAASLVEGDSPVPEPESSLLQPTRTAAMAIKRYGTGDKMRYRARPIKARAVSLGCESGRE
jgi:hypothetical protein